MLLDQVAQQIDLHSSRVPWARVAEILNELGVPTALAGRQWYPSTARNAALALRARHGPDSIKIRLNPVGPAGVASVR